MNPNFGATLKRSRLKAALSKPNLAAQLGITVPALEWLERRRNLPDGLMLAQITLGCGTTPTNIEAATKTAGAFKIGPRNGRQTGRRLRRQDCIHLTQNKKQQRGARTGLRPYGIIRDSHIERLVKRVMKQRGQKTKASTTRDLLIERLTQLEGETTKPGTPARPVPQP